MRNTIALIFAAATLTIADSCKDDAPQPEILGCTDSDATNYNPDATKDDGSCHFDSVDFVYDPTPYNLTMPAGFPAMNIPAGNPLTVKGVQLGRKLFYDPILSADSTQSCASCHAQPFAFSDKGLRFSIGIDGLEGGRNSMPVINIGWQPKLFWDGRANSVEDQALGPVVNPVEMHNTWLNAASKLQSHPDYPKWFGEAFGTSAIDSNQVVKAIAQFERTMISSNSKYDVYLYHGGDLTDQEERGREIYFTEKGDCFHCHGGIFLSDLDFHNNGIDTVFPDQGLGVITGNQKDVGLFKVPTLRNAEFTAPYMHDGRFQTLEQVIDHYSEGVRWSPTIDPLMKKVAQGGIHLTVQEKADLLAFLKTFTDMSFVNNPDYSNPF